MDPINMASNPFEARGAVGHSPPKKAKEDATLKNTAILKKAESIMLTSSEVDSRICIDCDPGYVYCSLNALKTHKSTKKHLDKVARNLQPPRDDTGEENEREVQRDRGRLTFGRLGTLSYSSVRNGRMGLACTGSSGNC